ncbi:exopolysaccharide biosynthesis polyprenyl glycosylphosphotransferase [Desulfoscipio gibsoniae DSM 7213]|uniref:Exopolysaccharide biosynthesis polyprenyl glycosylphosphotransferase n=1 Tax=Desulfoscipio gibsoniae DSM 7213 TaxID=767817 RepID=R4KMN6_9FIRM|nr:sugar transferase [Desulfoscipio gibsoniae]AGL03944.1 exopolysaccharide biosynthesis polyprenyl glycosylphosphotransferase [Desulfoscipio gibsoniae DSM 7213]
MNTHDVIKRWFDIILSLVLLIIFSPIMVIITLAIKITSPGEVIYRQQRLGRYGKIFYLLKFRSMVKNAESMGSGMLLEENDTRITPLGKFLRKTSLDELPQLINVLKGEMSMVGPRPAPVFHLPKYDDEQRRRLQFRPGITGWAQVNGRVALYWPQRIELDLWYIDHYSLLLDYKILLKTAWTVFDRKSTAAKPDRKDVDPFMKM